MKVAICINVASGAVAASAGRLIQLAMVRGRKRNELNCLATGVADQFNN